MIITLEMLEQDNACAEPAIAFRRAFPNGKASLSEIIAHPDCMPEWLGWAAAYARWVTAEIGPDLIERSNNPAHWRGRAAAYAHWASRNYFQADRKNPCKQITNVIK